MTKSFSDRVHQLNRQSVHKRYDAYVDVDWDAPENRVHPDDPRWELDDDHPLGRSTWYLEQPDRVRSQLGLHIRVHQLKVGIEFENILCRGLLEFAGNLDDHRPEFRYALHEVIEECHHSMMFQEVINRSGLHSPGLPSWEKRLTRWIPSTARTFPEMFFLFVLGGEEPIDYVQRRALRNKERLHPLLRTVTKIHVTEEARHICFAESFLDERMPRLSGWRRAHLRLRMPFVFHFSRAHMMGVPSVISARYNIPSQVLRAAFRKDPRTKADGVASIERIRELCARHGLIPKHLVPLWKHLGLWAPPTRGKAHRAPPRSPHIAPEQA